MGLESTTYISGLVSSNPTSSDFKTQGDDHLRLIKSAILSTFPNVTGAMTKTHTELNNALSSSNWAMNSDRLTNPGNTQPSFSAYRTSTQSSGTIVIFNNEVYDNGNCYNSSTGVFTAPITGTYLICTAVSFQENVGGSGSHGTQLYANSAASIGTFLKKYSPYEYWSASISTIFRLAAGNTVHVAVNNMVNVNVTSDSYGTLFAAHLLG